LQHYVRQSSTFIAPEEKKTFAEVIPIELQWLGEMLSTGAIRRHFNITRIKCLRIIHPFPAEPLCVLASIYSRQNDFKSAGKISQLFDPVKGIHN
jgi:hypothetical protein